MVSNPLLGIFLWIPDYFYWGHSRLIASSEHFNRGFSQGLGWIVLSVKWHSDKKARW